MSHPTRTRRPVPAVPLLAMFFAGLVGLGILVNAVPVAGSLLAIVIGAALLALYLRGGVIR